MQLFFICNVKKMHINKIITTAQKYVLKETWTFQNFFKNLNQESNKNAADICTWIKRKTFSDVIFKMDEKLLNYIKLY